MLEPSYTINRPPHPLGGYQCFDLDVYRQLSRYVASTVGM